MGECCGYVHKMAAMEREYTFAQLDAFDTSPEDTVLDVGCGPGRISVLMAQRAKSVTAIDSSEKMLNFAGKMQKKPEFVT